MEPDEPSTPASSLARTSSPNHRHAPKEIATTAAKRTRTCVHSARFVPPINYRELRVYVCFDRDLSVTGALPARPGHDPVADRVRAPDIGNPPHWLAAVNAGGFQNFIGDSDVV